MVTDKPPVRQLDLFLDYGQHSRATRRESMKSVRRPMLVDIIEFLKKCGRDGATRDEISVALRIAPTTPCYPVLQLLKDGELVETSERRPTRFGSPAAVVIHRDFCTKGGE